MSNKGVNLSWSPTYGKGFKSQHLHGYSQMHIARDTHNTLGRELPTRTNSGDITLLDRGFCHLANTRVLA
jgi:hypothetical protein